MRKHQPFLVVLLILILTCWATQELWAETVPRISKEDLKAQLGSKDLLILDVRTDRDWESSSLKIKDAIRRNPGIVDFWASDLPKDKTIVLYCA